MRLDKKLFFPAVALAMFSLGTGCDRDKNTNNEAPDATTRNEAQEVQEDRAEEQREQAELRREEAEDKAEESKDARELVDKSARTLEKMKADGKMKELINQSAGVLIIPDYGRAAVGVGARGGEGILVARQGDKWSNPIFYDIGGVSVGAQFGAEGGEIAMVLMNDKALKSFKEENKFSLNAGADFTMFDFSAMAASEVGKEGDIIFWSDKEGAFLGATLGLTDVAWDDEENQAYYGKKATPADILSGKITAPGKTSLGTQLSSI